MLPSATPAFFAISGVVVPWYPCVVKSSSAARTRRWCVRSAWLIGRESTVPAGAAPGADEVRLHCADLGGNTENVFNQKKLDREACARNVCVIPDCGLAPGMVNVLAAEGIRRVGDAETVKICVGGLPQHPEPPLNYQIVYSLEGALDYYTTPSWVLRSGKPTRVEALSDVEPVTFPPP